jgi:anti-sigma regulatory factor (Ser/Thr protein kinase)
MAGGVESESGSLHVLFDAVPDSVPEARQRVRAWCEGARVDGRIQADLLLAVTEAAANAVQHAYPRGRQGTFTLDARREDGEVVIEIRDKGVGMAAAPPSQGGGLGVEIIRRMFPRSTLSDADPGTRVVIRSRAG